MRIVAHALCLYGLLLHFAAADEVTPVERVAASEETADHTVALAIGPRPLAVYYNKLDPMPHVHFLYTPSGVNVIAGDTRKLPHPGHWGVFFGAGIVFNGRRQDFFHGAAKQVPTAARPSQGERGGVATAGFATDLEWKPGADSTNVLLRERRALTAYQLERQPQATLVEWRSELACPGGTNQVALLGYNFEGFGVRMLNPDGDLFGPTQRCDAGQNNRWIKGDWMAYAYTPEPDKEVTVAVFDHPDNVRRPTNWCGLNKPFDFGFVSPALGLSPDKDPWVIEAGKPATLRYAVAAWDGKVDKEEVAALFTWWAGQAGANQP